MSKYERPIKCCYVVKDEKKPYTSGLKIELEHEDGDPLSKNELVDIGREDRWPHKWPENIKTFYWQFQNYTPDIPERYWQMRSFAFAFRTIGFLIPRRYRFVRGTEKAHFNTEFHHDLAVFNDRGSVLAQAYLYHPNNPPGFNGLHQYNDNFFFTPFGEALPSYLVDPDHFTEGERDSRGRIKILATQPLIEIQMHENKHAHGYWHDTNSPESIMYPFVKNGTIITHHGIDFVEQRVNPGSVIWTDDDIERWVEGYGRRFFPWLGRFRARRLRWRTKEGIFYHTPP